jgi:hypothetical protein
MYLCLWEARWYIIAYIVYKEDKPEVIIIENDNFATFLDKATL